MSDCDAPAQRGRLFSILRLQYPDAIAENGFRLLHPTTGEPYSERSRHLVATCRSIANFAMGAEADGPEWCLDGVSHGLRFLRESHRTEGTEGYDLIVDPDGAPIETTRSAYGHAFVLLAYSRAVQAGIDDAEEDVRATHRLIEQRLRDDAGLLRSDCDADWTEKEQYRGQNANMHACEAYIAAYEATGRGLYLDRASQIATSVTVELADRTDGLLWEHFTEEWDHDFSYNQDDPYHQFRPPGYQAGHHAEWAKLLALLDRYGDEPDATVDSAGPGDGWYPRAVELFEAAIDLGWTGDGFVYTVDRDGEPIVRDRYGWALAEALGAAAALSERATRRGHSEDRDRFIERVQEFVDCTERYRGPAGLWYEKRRAPADGDRPVAPEPPGVEPDYHPQGAFFESWRSLKRVADRE